MLIDNVDLFGCGAYGLSAQGCAGAVTVRNSILRACEYGPFALYGCTGKISFTGCAFLDSDGGGEYESAPGGTLRFENCEFGRNETDVWQDSADAETVDCIFGVVTTMPNSEKGL